MVFYRYKKDYKQKKNEFYQLIIWLRSFRICLLILYRSFFCEMLFYFLWRNSIFVFSWIKQRFENLKMITQAFRCVCMCIYIAVFASFSISCSSPCLCQHICFYYPRYRTFFSRFPFSQRYRVTTVFGTAGNDIYKSARYFKNKTGDQINRSSPSIYTS